MRKFTEGYFQFLQVLLTIMLMVLIVPVFLQVVSPVYPFIPRYIWTEEIARFAFIWVIMLGATGCCEGKQPLQNRFTTTIRS